MKRNLGFNGNSWYIYINKPLAQMLGLNKDEYTVSLYIENKILYANKIASDEIEKYKNSLCKKLLKRKAGFCLAIPLPILEMLDINPEEDLIDCEINKNTLTIKKAD